MRPAALVLALAVPLAACGSAPSAPESTETCDGFGDWQSTAYVLPDAIVSSSAAPPRRRAPRH